MTKRLLFAKNRSSCRIHTAFKHNNAASNKFHKVNAILRHRQYRSAMDIMDERCCNDCRCLILRSVVAGDYQRPSIHTASSCFLCYYLWIFDEVGDSGNNELRAACQFYAYPGTIILPPPQSVLSISYTLWKWNCDRCRSERLRVLEEKLRDAKIQTE